MAVRVHDSVRQATISTVQATTLSLTASSVRLATTAVAVAMVIQTAYVKPGGTAQAVKMTPALLDSTVH